MCRHSYFCLLDIPGLCNTCHIFSSSCVVSEAFSLLCTHYACIQRSGIVLTKGYACAKFRFSRGLHCWASPWRITYSINHSITQSFIHPAYLMCRDKNLTSDSDQVHQISYNMKQVLASGARIRLLLKRLLLSNKIFQIFTIAQKSYLRFAPDFL